jgi:hypothetical protein
MKDMNNEQDTSREISGSTAKQKKTRNIWIAVCCLLVLGILICVVYFSAARPLANLPSANLTVSGNKTPNIPVTLPPEVSTPPYTPPSTQVSTPPLTPSPQPVATPQPSVITPSVRETLIKKESYQMVLTLEDMGLGWRADSAISPPRTLASSSSHVVYIKGSAFPPVLQNTVTVYRTDDSAKSAFNADIPATTANVKLSYPNIGDECFLNDSIPFNKALVFRKNNVVVWIIIQQDKSSDPEHYARIVEQRIP